MRERVDINGVRRAAPGLDLLGNLLGMWGGEDTGDAGIAEGVWQRVQQLGDSIGEANRGENTGAYEGIAAEGVEERVVGARERWMPSRRRFRIWS